MSEATITCPTCDGHPASASTRSEGGSISCRHCNRTLTFNVMRAIEEGRDLECGCTAARRERCETCLGEGTISIEASPDHEEPAPFTREDLDRARVRAGIPPLGEDHGLDPETRLVASGGACAPVGDLYRVEPGIPGLTEAAEAWATERPAIRFHQPLQPWEMWDDGFGCYRLSLIGAENERRLADARFRVRNAWGFVRCAVPPLRSAWRVLNGRPPYPEGDDFDPEYEDDDEEYQLQRDDGSPAEPWDDDRINER